MDYCNMALEIPASPIRDMMVRAAAMEDEFILTPEAVREAITPKTKVLMLNSPCNPTGGVISKESLKEIAEISVEHDLFVLSDEVYRHILFDGEEYASIVTEPGMRDRTRCRGIQQQIAR